MPKDISDYIDKPDIPPKAEKIKLPELEGKEFVVKSWKSHASRFRGGTYVTIRLEMDGKLYRTNMEGELVSLELENIAKRKAELGEDDDSFVCTVCQTDVGWALASKSWG